MPQFFTYPVNTDNHSSTFILHEELNEKMQEDESDRQLVCLLPD